MEDASQNGNGHDPGAGTGLGPLTAAPLPTALSRPSPDGLSAQPSAISPAKLAVYTLRRWWLVVLPIGLVLGTAAGTIVWFSLPREYKASAWFSISPQIFIAYKVDQDPAGFLESQLQLLRSPVILDRAIEQDPTIIAMPEVNEQPEKIKWLQERISIRQAGKSEHFEVTFQGPDAKNAATIVNAIVNVYGTVSQTQKSRRFDSIFDKISREIDSRKTKLETLRENVKTTAGDLPSPFEVADPAQRQVVLADPLLQRHNQLLQQKTLTEVRRSMLQVRLEVLSELSASANDEVAKHEVENTVEQAVEVGQLRGEMERLEREMEGIAETSRLGKQNPKYQSLEAQLREEAKKLEELRKRLSAEFVERSRKQFKEARIAELNTLKAEVKGEERAEQVLGEKLKGLEKEIQAKQKDDKIVREVSLNYLFAKRHYEEELDVYRRLEERKRQIEIEGRAEGRVELITPAKPPSVAENKFPLKQSLPAALIGLLLPFGLALAWEWHVKRIRDVDHLKEVTSVAIVGEVARLPSRRISDDSEFMESTSGDFAFYQESINSLSTNLVLYDGDTSCQVIAVTSAVCQEGKTSISAQLAISLRRLSGSPVLLVDGDMRAPDIHRSFDVSNEHGLADVLAQRCSVADAIVASEIGGLDVMPAGRAVKSPHDLLGNGVWHRLLDDLRGKYRYIVLDTPPILSASEALLLARGADTALLCALRNVSRTSGFLSAYERLQTANISRVGVVLSGVPTSEYASKYGSYPYATAEA